MKNLLYISAIVGNFLLLIYAVILIVGISGGWLDRELWLHSDVAKVAQLLLMASAMGLLFANIRISREQYGGRYLSLVLCGNFFINPFLSLYFLSGKADNKQTSTAFSKRNVYLFLRNVQIFWLLYTFAAVFYTPLIESKVGGIFYISLMIAVSIFIQQNITIAIKNDTPGYLLLNIWFCFIYAPFYSRRVLKNNWL
ncbi:hypothetical protein [uncultured Muribaculum sp.]|uniref:hypothetical protein n=1 Tax=uncultured Muribaculum sp. TaxID=1918613 RepID=UPI002606D194|nr:hypothetical protein [uncultured Muribaculum sp.]